MNKRSTILILATILMLVIGSVAGSPLMEGKRLTLELEEAPIITVLNLIASQNELNLVVSGQVTGEVTMRLNDVDVAAALESILSPNGYNYYLRDDIVVVKPIDLFTPDELITRTIRLRYANAHTVLDALSARKSPRGQVIILGASATQSADKLRVEADRLLVSDYPRLVDEMLLLVQELDKPLRMISIEVKLIETNMDDETRLGVTWPSQLSAAVGNATNGSTNSTSTTDQNNTAGTTSLSLLKDLNSGRWTWGTLGVEQLGIMLDFLEQNDNSKLVSDPRITTLENHEAEIKLETIIPIPTISRFTEGASTADIQTFEDEEVGITLRVTPRINEDGKITMDVFPQVEEIIGYTGPADSQKPITTSRSVRTRITVINGETAVLGGLVKENQIERVQKVPLLGSIPLIGKLFSSKSMQRSKTDLIILITPTVLP